MREAPRLLITWSPDLWGENPHSLLAAGPRKMAVVPYRKVGPEKIVLCVPFHPQAQRHFFDLSVLSNKEEA